MLRANSLGLLNYNDHIQNDMRYVRHAGVYVT